MGEFANRRGLPVDDVFQDQYSSDSVLFRDPQKTKSRFASAGSFRHCPRSPSVPIVGATEGAPPRVANRADFADPPDLRGEVAQLVRATES
jgi:hypothetical protein